MRNDNDHRQQQEKEEGGGKGPKAHNMDITDPERDRQRLEPEEAIIELPDVKDIPGQEFVNAPPLGMMADTTISSADEEGEGLFDEDDEEDIVMGTEADVTADEKESLSKADYFMPTQEEESLEQSRLDHTDFEGEVLNEKGFGTERSGADLDIPSEIEDMTVNATGNEDEENPAS